MSELEQAMLRYYEDIAISNMRDQRRHKPRPRPAPKPVFVQEEAEAALQAILQDVSFTKHVSEHTIKSTMRRVARVMDARLEFYYRAAKETNLPYSIIGKFCGDRDPTTIASGVGAHCKRNGLQHPRDLDCSSYEKRIAHNLRYKMKGVGG